MKHEVYSAFPCISFRNINSGTLKNARVSISCKLSAIFSVLYLAHGKHSLSVKTQFLRRVVQFPPFILSNRVILSIYRFKRDNFLSENVIFESKTFIQNAHHSKSLLDVRLVEKLGHLPPDKNIPSRG